MLRTMREGVSGSTVRRATPRAAGNTVLISAANGYGRNRQKLGRAYSNLLLGKNIFCGSMYLERGDEGDIPRGAHARRQQQKAGGDLADGQGALCGPGQVCNDAARDGIVVGVKLR